MKTIDPQNEKKGNNMDLEKFFIDELGFALTTEKTLVKTLPKIAEAVCCPDVKESIIEHLQQTKGHVSRIEKIFKSLGKPARGHRCEGLDGIIAEGKQFLEISKKVHANHTKHSKSAEVAKDGESEEGRSMKSEQTSGSSDSLRETELQGAVANMGLIAGCLKVEHYEMALYRTLLVCADALGRRDAVELLRQTFNEERDADRILHEHAQIGAAWLRDPERKNVSETTSKERKENMQQSQRRDRYYEEPEYREHSRRRSYEGYGEEGRGYNGGYGGEESWERPRDEYGQFTSESGSHRSRRGYGGEEGWERPRDEYGQFTSEGEGRYEYEGQGQHRGRSHRGGGRGFASMDPERQRQIASMGGHASHGGQGGGYEEYEGQGGYGRYEEYEGRGSSRRGEHRGGGRSRRGFASMDPDRQREIASMGGRHSHDND